MTTLAQPKVRTKILFIKHDTQLTLQLTEGRKGPLANDEPLLSRQQTAGEREVPGDGHDGACTTCARSPPAREGIDRRVAKHVTCARKFFSSDRERYACANLLLAHRYGWLHDACPFLREVGCTVGRQRISRSGADVLGKLSKCCYRD